MSCSFPQLHKERWLREFREQCQVELVSTAAVHWLLKFSSLMECGAGTSPCRHTPTHQPWDLVWKQSFVLLLWVVCYQECQAYHKGAHSLYVVQVCVQLKENNKLQIHSNNPKAALTLPRPISHVTSSQLHLLCKTHQCAFWGVILINYVFIWLKLYLNHILKKNMYQSF